jgi:hypothetical protein
MRTLGPLVAVLVLASSSCGGDETTTIGSSGSQTSPVQPTVTRLFINGTPPTLDAIGQTARVTAVATYSDGTTGDVSAQATWTSSNPTLFTVSAGLVTAVNYGLARINASLQNRGSSITATATPPGTFIMTGRAREPGFSGISGVRILETLSNRSTLTDSNGEYSLAALTSVRSLKFDKDGYENIEIVPTDIGSQLVRYAEGALQRVVRLSPGETLGLQIAPHDVAHDVGSYHCYPCKVVRVTTPGGTLRLTATWTRESALFIWIGSQRFEPTDKSVIAEAAVASGEIPVYIGWNLPAGSDGALDYAIFSLTASMVGS